MVESLPERMLAVLGWESLSPAMLPGITDPERIVCVL